MKKIRSIFSGTLEWTENVWNLGYTGTYEYGMELIQKVSDDTYGHGRLVLYGTIPNRKERVKNRHASSFMRFSVACPLFFQSDNNKRNGR